ncbi:MAG: molybdopterin-binding protein [Bilophila wadsworthia]
MAARREHWALAWITLSDKGAAGLRVDESGPLMAADTRAKLPLCHEQGFMIPDDPQTLRSLVMELALGQGYDLILTSGGTGLAPRDTTPEALLPIFERRLPGFEQAMMQASPPRRPPPPFPRRRRDARRTIVITLPGSRKAFPKTSPPFFPPSAMPLKNCMAIPPIAGNEHKPRQVESSKYRQQRPAVRPAYVGFWHPIPVFIGQSEKGEKQHAEAGNRCGSEPG